MRSTGRLLIVIAAALAALGFAQVAFATQRLVVSQTGARLTVTVAQKATDPQPARVAVFAPAGYQLDLSRTSGTIGTASGSFFLRDTNTPEAVSGDLVADKPTAQESPACSTGTHRAVWALALSGRTVKLRVPVYVDQPSRAQSNLGQLRLTLCFGPSQTPKGTPGRSPSGAHLLRVSFTLGSSIVTPPVGPTLWKALSTPYALTTQKADESSTVEARSYVGAGGVTLFVRKLGRAHHRRFLIYGRVTKSSMPMAGVTVRILVNGRARFTAITRANGGYRIVRKAPRGHHVWRFRAQAIAGTRDVTADGCGNPSLNGVRCVSATSSPFTAFSRVIRLRF